MGWLFKPGSTRRGMIAERVRGWERTTPTGTSVKTRCIAHCYRGGVFKGGLWTVWERTLVKNGEQERPTKRWIGCDLLDYSKADEGWGYKDMEEGMHPYFYSCPLKYLALVPAVASEEWREGVRQYHAGQNEMRLAKTLLKNLSVTE